MNESLTPDENAEDRELQEWYDQKSAIMDKVLGPEHDMVMHSLISYGAGGGLDLYYYPNGIEGTAIATKELCETPGEGSSNAVYDNYELVMFTKHPIDLDLARDDSTAFGRAHLDINAFLNCVGPYSAQATLNPNETCEFPEDMKRIGGRCMIFDAYSGTEDSSFGLLLIIEVFRSEMDFARGNGGQQLIDLLKEAGHYPYSDLDREPVV